MAFATPVLVEMERFSLLQGFPELPFMRTPGVIVPQPATSPAGSSIACQSSFIR